MKTPARFTPAPDARAVAAMVSTVGGLPSPAEKAPDDPAARWVWCQMHPGRDPNGQRAGDPEIARLESLEVATDGDIFPTGVVLVSRKLRREFLEVATGRLGRHQPRLDVLLARHRSGDLGDDGRLDPSRPAAFVKSRYALRPPSKEEYMATLPGSIGAQEAMAGWGRQVQDPCWIAICTVFGVPDAADEGLRRAITLACLAGEPYTGLFVPQAGRPDPRWGGILQVWQVVQRS